MAAGQWPGETPQEWSALLEWDGDGGFWNDLRANRWMLLGVGIPLAIAGLAGQIGMFLFWRFARPLYAVFVAVMALSTPFAGVVVLLPVQAAWADLSLIADGAIIALSYSQPFSSYFERQRDHGTYAH